MEISSRGGLGLCETQRGRESQARETVKDEDGWQERDEDSDSRVGSDSTKACLARYVLCILVEHCGPLSQRMHCLVHSL